MTTYTITNLTSGKAAYVVAMSLRDAASKYATTIRRAEINAADAAKQVNTIRAEISEAGTYEISDLGKPLCRFSVMVKFYTPQRAYAPAHRVVSVSDLSREMDRADSDY